MQASPLMDAPRFARNIEAAYRQMWRNWCQQGEFAIPDPMPLQQQFESAWSHHRAGHLAEAQRIYRQVLARQPDHPKALNRLGVLVAQMGQLDAAVELIRRAVGLKPDFAEAHCNLGKALTDLGRLAEAIASYQQAIRLKPDLAEVHSNLGITLTDAGQFEEAVGSCREAIRLKPDFAGAHNNLGNALYNLGRLDEAIASYRQAIRLKPDYAEAHNNLGDALATQGQLDQAIASYRQAIRFKPDYALAHKNLANALKDMGQLDESIASYRQAIRLKPDFAQAHWNYGLLLLMLGEFQEGWKEFEWRLRVPRLRLARHLPQPRWTGQDARGKTILLLTEGGFGDAIHFIRYAPLVAARGATVLLECQAKLVPLLSRVEGISAVFARGERLPAFDWQAPLPSLPLVFGTTMNSIPAANPYLSTDPALVEKWSKRLGATDERLRVGLAWAGNPRFKADRTRSLNLQQLAPFAAAAEAKPTAQGAKFFSLQIGPRGEQAKSPPTGMDLVDWTEELTDFADTAALIVNLDLVIAVDTAMAHLAGAMGKPTWVLLPFAPDWRWLLRRQDSPWYPTMRLFRQPAVGQWDPVIESVTAELPKHVSRTGLGQVCR
jgi:tetratricopeptide (TPR) repeat protein